ncbi:response regulator [Sphingomonas sp. TDK1]|uniref:response regulator n=1 Tax=Sphingomonas sp. TDK1 TaxID=453247 RepID=UPI0007D9CABE|nr:response regulator [Sphingomonas sp. TDK1]OAN57576.1 hypothetical protein A7X12_06815 [Sphingomonas sp. TDK1]
MQNTVIAIIDDDRLVLEALGSLLRSFGYAVSLFSTATAFRKAERAQIACILSDYQMPDMSGIELACKLREDGDRTPIVMMTAFAQDSTREQAMAAGIVEVLEKPLEGEILLAAIARALVTR